MKKRRKLKKKPSVQKKKFKIFNNSHPTPTEADITTQKQPKVAGGENLQKDLQKKKENTEDKTKTNNSILNHQSTDDSIKVPDSRNQQLSNDSKDSLHYLKDTKEEKENNILKIRGKEDITTENQNSQEASLNKQVHQDREETHQERTIKTPEHNISYTKEAEELRTNTTETRSKAHPTTLINKSSKEERLDKIEKVPLLIEARAKDMKLQQNSDEIDSNNSSTGSIKTKATEMTPPPEVELPAELQDEESHASQIELLPITTRLTTPSPRKERTPKEERMKEKKQIHDIVIEHPDSDQTPRSLGSPNLYLSTENLDTTMQETHSPLNFHSGEDIPGAVTEKTPISRLQTSSSDARSHFIDSENQTEEEKGDDLPRSLSLLHVEHPDTLEAQKVRMSRKPTLMNLNTMKSSSSYSNFKTKFSCRNISIPLYIIIVFTLAFFLFVGNQAVNFVGMWGAVSYRFRYTPKVISSIQHSEEKVSNMLYMASNQAHTLSTLINLTYTTKPTIDEIQQLFNRYQTQIDTVEAQQTSSFQVSKNIYKEDPGKTFNLNDVTPRPWSKIMNFTMIHFQNVTHALLYQRNGTSKKSSVQDIESTSLSTLNQSFHGWQTFSYDSSSYYGYMLPSSTQGSLYIGIPTSSLLLKHYLASDVMFILDQRTGLIVDSNIQNTFGMTLTDISKINKNINTWYDMFSASQLVNEEHNIFLIEGITPGYETFIRRIASPSIDLLFLAEPRTNYSFHLGLSIFILCSVCLLIIFLSFIGFNIYTHIILPLQQMDQLLSRLQNENYSKETFNAYYEAPTLSPFAEIFELKKLLFTLIYKLERFLPFVPQDVIESDDEDSGDTESSQSSITEEELSIIQSDEEEIDTAPSHDQWLVSATDDDIEATVSGRTGTTPSSATPGSQPVAPDIFKDSMPYPKKLQVSTLEKSFRTKQHTKNSYSHKNKPLRYGQSTVMVVWLHNVEHMLDTGMVLSDFSARYAELFSKVRVTARSHRGVLDNFSESIIVLTFRRVVQAVDAAITMDGHLQHFKQSQFRNPLVYSIGISSGREWHGLIGDESMKKRHSFGRVSRRAKHLATVLFPKWGSRVVVCEQTARQIENEYKVAPFSYVEKSEMGRTLAYQLAGKYDLWDGEWMYKLRVQQEKRDLHLFKEAFQQFSEGNMMKALELFEQFSKTDTNELVSNLTHMFTKLCHANPHFVTVSHTTNFAKTPNFRKMSRARSTSVSHIKYKRQSSVNSNSSSLLSLSKVSPIKPRRDVKATSSSDIITKQ